MKLTCIAVFMVLIFGCTKTNTEDDSASDSTNVGEQNFTVADSIGTTHPSSVDEFGSKPDYYLGNQNLNAFEFQLIEKSCAILISATASQKEAMLKQLEVEREQAHAQWEQAKTEWEKQPHDTSERFDEEENYGTDDGMFYQWKAQNTFAELKIDTITIKEKGFVKLMGKNQKQWTLDIRSNMTPDWTIILFNVNKEPKVIEAIDVTKERMVQYFLEK